MKLLRCIHTMSLSSGGPIEGIRQISPFLGREGVQTSIATLDHPNASLPSVESCEILPLGPGKGPTHQSQRYRTWLLQNIRKFDVAIVHGLWLYNGYGFWSANRSSAIPYFVYSHGMLDPWFKRAYPIKHLFKQCLWLMREHRVLRDAQAVLFTSERERILARHTFRPYQVKERVVKYGVATPAGDREADIAAFQDRFTQTRKRPTILFLSRLHEKKGCDLLLEAFARAREDGAIPQDTLLVMAGSSADAGYESSLRQLARDKLGGEHAELVLWTGHLEGDLKTGALASADLFVLPSHQENFGIAVVEALAQGTPVLTTTAVNICQEIEKDEAGLIVEDTLSGIEDGLREFYALSANDKERLSRNARDCFHNRYHMQSSAEDLYQLLATAMKSGKNGPRP